MKRVVEFGDGWHIGPVALEEIKPKLAQLRELMAAAGRDFSQLEITSMVDTRVLSPAAFVLTAIWEYKGSTLWFQDQIQRAC